MDTKGGKTDIAVFAGGCFWCTEAVFGSLKGVKSVIPGYAGGDRPNPTYHEVSIGNSGHVEAVKVEYDPSIVAYDDLLAVFFGTHDPTTANRQGEDVGTQYRSAIFYADDEQKNKADNMIRRLDQSGSYNGPIVTEVKPLSEFYGAEEYHREYWKNNKSAPYCELVIGPKLEDLKEKFSRLLA